MQAFFLVSKRQQLNYFDTLSLYLDIFDLQGEDGICAQFPNGSISEGINSIDANLFCHSAVNDCASVMQN